MTNDNKKNSGSSVVIPDNVKEKFPDLVKMIMASESMDDEERKYWFSVLPIMTETQVAELRDILETEKKKLAAIDAKYADSNKKSEIQLSEDEIKKAEEKRREAKEKRKSEEIAHQKEAEDKAEEMLAQLENV